MKVNHIKFYNTKLPNTPTFKSSPLALAENLAFKQSNLNTLNKFFLNASKWGEKETILLNGVGKTLLAPFIILFNPFIGNMPPYKKENKEYMALKQPVTGLVNMGVQLGILLGLDNGFNHLIKKGILAADLADTKHLTALKGTASLALALVTMPFACSLGNKIYSKLANKFLKGKKYDSKNN